MIETRDICVRKRIVLTHFHFCLLHISWVHVCKSFAPSHSAKRNKQTDKAERGLSRTGCKSSGWRLKKGSAHWWSSTCCSTRNTTTAANIHTQRHSGTHTAGSLCFANLAEQEPERKGTLCVRVCVRDNGAPGFWLSKAFAPLPTGTFTKPVCCYLSYRK